MFRKIVRDGIRAVADGRDPSHLLRAPAPTIATACQDTVLRIPVEAELAAEARLLRETGRHAQGDATSLDAVPVCRIPQRGQAT